MDRWIQRNTHSVLACGALPRFTEYVLVHRARPVKRRNMHWVREPTQTPSRGLSGLMSSLTPRRGMSRDVFATSHRQSGKTPRARCTSNTYWSKGEHPPHIACMHQTNVTQHGVCCTECRCTLACTGGFMNLRTRGNIGSLGMCRLILQRVYVSMNVTWRLCLLMLTFYMITAVSYDSLTLIPL